MGETVTGHKFGGYCGPKNEDSIVTRSVHYLRTPDSKARPEKFKENVVVLSALGGKDEIKIPSDYTYHSPQCLWISYTWVENNPQLVSEINDAYRDDDDEDATDLPAKFTIHHSGSVTEPGKRIQRVSKGGDVRHPDKSSDLEVWAHLPKLKSVINHLLDDERFTEWFRSLDLEQDITSEVEKVYNQFFAADRLPASAKYATIQIRIINLARPNQMGIASLKADPDNCNTVIPAESGDKTSKASSKLTDQAKPRKSPIVLPDSSPEGFEQSGTPCKPSLDESKSTRISNQNYDSAPRVLCGNMSSLPPAEAGTRPKQDLASVISHPSRDEAKQFKSELLLMENDDKVHMQFRRPEALFTNYTVEYIVNVLMPETVKVHEDRCPYRKEALVCCKS